MKSKKVNAAIAMVVLAGFTYGLLEVLRTKSDRLYRYAAGESDYERTKIKSRKRTTKTTK